MPKKEPQLKLLNDLWKIIQWMSEVPENEKAESKGFKKAFGQLEKAYLVKTATRIRKKK